ncbi:MAG: AbrB/MazE/SpoVT family DNA-binding domain-containing protein [Burkholderiales bacterium]
MHRSTVVSQKGQVVLPKALRDAYRWPAGTRLLVQETPDGLLLTAATSAKTRDARSIAGCTGYRGPVRSIEDMQTAIKRGIAARHARG